MGDSLATRCANLFRPNHNVRRVKLVFAYSRMQATLPHDPREARVFLAHALFPALRAVRVADADVAVVPQRVVRQVVGLQVLPDVAVAPVGERMDLPAAVAQFEEVDLFARACLGAADTGEPGAG